MKLPNIFHRYSMFACYIKLRDVTWAVTAEEFTRECFDGYAFFKFLHVESNLKALSRMGLVERQNVGSRFIPFYRYKVRDISGITSDDVEYR